MEWRGKYKDLPHTLEMMKYQILDGVPYAAKHLPKFRSPEEIFHWLKLRTVYFNDPAGTELLQSLPTLLENNYHGVAGAGDCDCFTIALLTILYANGFKGCGFSLVGRSKKAPVHIYAEATDGNKLRPMDLTSPFYDYERTKYKYKQFVPMF